MSTQRLGLILADNGGFAIEEGGGRLHVAADAETMHRLVDERVELLRRNGVVPGPDEELAKLRVAAKVVVDCRRTSRRSRASGYEGLDAAIYLLERELVGGGP